MKSQQERIPKQEDFDKGSQKDKDTAEGLVQRGQDIISKLSESLHNISSSITHTAQNLLQKVWIEYPNPEKDLDPKIKENIKRINQEIIKRGHRKERVIESEGKGGEFEKATLMQKAKEGIHEFSEKFTHGVENFEKRFEKHEEPKSTKPVEKERIAEKGPSFIDRAKETISEISGKFAGKTESVETEEKEGRFVDLAPTEKINPAELKQFHEVKTGFSETVSEFQHEKRIEEVGQETIKSNNPFEVLGDENLNVESSTQEGRPMTEKLREGLSETTSRISSKIAETKEKILSSLAHEKENVGTS